jgi:hypothetical protein
MSYQGDATMYAYRNHPETNDATFINMTFDNTTTVYKIENIEGVYTTSPIQIKEIEESCFDTLTELNNITPKCYFSATSTPWLPGKKNVVDITQLFSIVKLTKG